MASRSENTVLGSVSKRLAMDSVALYPVIVRFSVISLNCVRGNYFFLIESLIFHTKTKNGMARKVKTHSGKRFVAICEIIVPGAVLIE